MVSNIYEMAFTDFSESKRKECEQIMKIIFLLCPLCLFVLLISSFDF